MSYGATVRFGGSPGGLASRRVNLYLLAGVRFTAAAFTNSYHGCFSPDPCRPAEFGSGTEDRDFDFTVWKSGVGLEKLIGGGTADPGRGEPTPCIRTGGLGHAVR